MRFEVKVQARAKQDEVAGARDGVLRLRVKAPPAEGRANEAVVRLLAEWLRVPRASISIVAGARSSRKLIGVEAAPAIETRLRHMLE